MSEVTGVKEDAKCPAESSDDSDCPEVEDEESGGSFADEDMMQWALKTLQRTQYLSDSENEYEEKKEKCPVRVRSAKKKSASKNQASWKNVSTVLSQIVTPEIQKSSARRNGSAVPVLVAASPPAVPSASPSDPSAAFSPSAAEQSPEDPIACEPMEQCDGDTVFPETECSMSQPVCADIDAFEKPVEDPLGESVSVCPVPVSAPPPVAPSAVTIKEEPPLSPLATAQNAEDPLGNRALEPTDWCSGDSVVPRTEFSTTPSPPTEIEAFDKLVEDPLGENVSACPVPVAALPPVQPFAVTIKKEPPPSPSSPAQNTEDPLKDSALDSMDWCGGDTSPESSTPTPPFADMDAFSQTVSEESIEDALASLQMEWVTLPTTAECIVSPSGVIRDKQFLTAVSRASTTKLKSDCNDCTAGNKMPSSSGEFSSVISKEVSESPLSGDNEEDHQKKGEALRTKELICSGDISEDVWEKFVASVPPPCFPTTWKVQPSTPEEKAVFRAQELQRFYNRKRAYTYWLHGYESVVGPVKMSCFAARRPGSPVVVITDLRVLCSLNLVCDAVARLPNGVGTLEDIVQLLSDSQFLCQSLPGGASLVSKVTSMLSFLNWEEVPTLCFSAKLNKCVYLHRGRSEEELESLYRKQPNAPEASKAVGSRDVKEVEKGGRTESLIICDGPPGHPPQEHAQLARTYPGKRMRHSDSGPQPVFIDPDTIEVRCSPRKLQVIADSDGANVVIPATSGKELSTTAPVNAVPSSSAIALTSSVLSSSSTVSSPVTALSNSVLSLSPATTLGDGILSSSSSTPPPTALAGVLSLPCLSGAQLALKPSGPSARSPQANAQPTLGPQPVCIDPNNTEQRHVPGNVPVVVNNHGCPVVVPVSFGEQSLARAPVGVMATLISSPSSSSSRVTWTSGNPPLLSTVPTTVLTNTRRLSPTSLASRVVSSSSLANGVLVSSPSTTSAAIRLVNGRLVLLPQKIFSAEGKLVASLPQPSLLQLRNTGVPSSPNLLSSTLPVGVAPPPSSSPSSVAAASVIQQKQQGGTNTVLRKVFVVRRSGLQTPRIFFPAQEKLSVSANEVLSSSPSPLPPPPSSSSSSSSGVVSAVEQEQPEEQQQPEAKIVMENMLQKSQSGLQTLPVSQCAQKNLPSGLVKMGVVPSDSSITTSAVSSAVEESTQEKAASGETRIVNVAKEGSITDDTMTSKTVASAAPGASDILPAKPLTNEGICVRCYKWLLNSEERNDDPNALEKEVRIVMAPKGGNGEGSADASNGFIVNVQCSVCDTSSLKRVIVKHILCLWVHQCKRCELIFMNSSKLSNHEEICTLGQEKHVRPCLICEPGIPHAYPEFFYMRLMCPLCGQLFVSYFHFLKYTGVFWKNYMDVNIRGFSCIVCGSQVREKISLNVHMRQHKELSLQVVEGRTFCPMTGS